MDSRKQGITIGDLLSMTSGLDWKFENDISSNEMLKSANWTKYTLDLPMREYPGGKFNYSDGAAHVASAIIQKATGKTSYEYCLERFAALEITDCYWGMNPENVTNGASGMFLKPDDMAKLGYLYLKNGEWNGEQLIPKEWVKKTTELHTGVDWTPYMPGYGYFWWITEFGKYKGYAALGNGGNYIFVVPDIDLVVVFTSGIYDNSVIFYPCELMDRFIIPAVRSDIPLPKNDDAAVNLNEAISAVQDPPVPESVSLPETALYISEKIYDISGTSAVFHFKKGSDHFTFELNSVTYTAGLDGVFRICDVGGEGSLPDHNHVAAKGSWQNENILRIEMQGIEDAYINIYTVFFKEDSITVDIDSTYWTDRTVSGSISG